MDQQLDSESLHVAGTDHGDAVADAYRRAVNPVDDAANRFAEGDGGVHSVGNGDEIAGVGNDGAGVGVVDASGDPCVGWDLDSGPQAATVPTGP